MPALAGALLGGCGASWVNDAVGDRQQLAGSPAASAQPAAPQTPNASAVQNPATPGDQNAAVRKVALTVMAVSDPASKAYKIGPRDVLDVTVFKVPELSKTLQVSETGTINYPLLGEVQAGGRTARELEQVLTKSLGAKFLQNPQVTVFVKDYNSQRITIEGAVKKPGVYPIAGGLSLLQAIAQAQGLEQTAEETAVVFRQVDGKRQAGRYDITKIRDGRADDPQLQSGDVIIVPTSDVKEGLNLVLRLVPLATVVPLL